MDYSSEDSKKRQAILDDVYGEDHVAIPITEYEALQADSRRVVAVRNALEELTMRRKLLKDDTTSKEYMTRLITLRRNALSKIYQIIDRSWNG